MKSAIVRIDPDMARIFLSSNGRNRRLNDKRVRHYARAMSEGAWVVSNDAVTFDSDGQLLNGQHRMAAIVESNTTQDFLVLRAVPADTQNVMDTGAPRRAGQQLGLAGWKNGDRAASTARLLLRWHTGGLSTGDYRPTITEIYNFAERYRTRLEAAVEVSHRVSRKVPLRQAIVGAVAFTAYDLAAERPETLTMETVNEFFELLETGANMPADHPIMTLRDRAIRYRGGLPSRRVDQTDVEQLYDMVRTWNAFRKGERNAKLQKPQSGAITLDHLRMK